MNKPEGTRWATCEYTETGKEIIEAAAGTVKVDFRMAGKSDRKRKRAGNDPLRSTEIILESISDGVFTVDRDWRITSFNRAAEEITGISRKEAVGKPCSEVFRASMCEGDCALHHTMETGKPVINKPTFIVDADEPFVLAGSNIPDTCPAAPVTTILRFAMFFLPPAMNLVVAPAYFARCGQAGQAAGLLKRSCPG